MSVLYDTIKAIDDDYLTGLSNKGTVKRAYKDLEGMNIEPVMSPDLISFDFDGIKCELRMPLSDSTCSCPQIGICRHIVTLILASKEKLKNETGDGTEEIPDGKTDTEIAENREIDEKPVDIGELAAKEIAEFPLEEILKKLSPKILEDSLERIRTKDFPRITKSQIITVEDDSDESVVKLMHPLSASGCTCHKQGMCSHKLKALLFVKVSENPEDTSEIEKYLLEENEKGIDPEKVKETEKRIKGVLSEIFTAGLARLSPAMKDRMFEMALLCHNFRMPDPENLSRELGNLIEKYQSKSAEVSNVQMMEKAVNMFLKRDTEGEFRSEYHSVHDLYLTGLGTRSFRSSGGYVGESIYFIEKNTGKYYTYTNAVADFYDGRKARPGADAVTIWNLGIPIKGLVGNSVRVYHGKVNRSHRLSSSSETRADLAGNIKDVAGELKKYIYEDFSLVWKDYFSNEEMPGDEEYKKLIMVRPARLSGVGFDNITQRLQGCMKDSCGREITISLQYKKEEATAIRGLERLAEKIEKNGTKPPVFLGIVYISDERLMFYPIETVDDLSEDAEEAAGIEEVKEAEEQVRSLEADKVQILEFLKECRTLISDIFTCGLAVIPAYLSGRLQEAEESALKYGLLKLSGIMKEFYELIERTRHSMEEKEEDRERKVMLFCLLAEYIRIGTDLCGKEIAGERLGISDRIIEKD